jgi:DNA polymerase-3 subunit alpha
MSELTKSKNSTFVHLHMHTEFSLIDGSIRINKALSKAKEWGHHAMAITDSGALFGVVDFYTKAKAEGIKAIIGSEIYFSGHPETLKIAQSEKTSWPHVGAFHLVFLCKNNQGYKNLCKIVSRGYTEGLHEVPIVSQECLSQHSGDLIALSGDKRSELSYLVQLLRFHQNEQQQDQQPDRQKNQQREGQQKSQQRAQKTPLQLTPTETTQKTILDAIESHIRAIHSYVGTGNYYVELIDNKLSGQREHLYDLVSIAQHFNLPLVCSADAHYLDESFAKSHSVLVAIKSGYTFKDLRSRNKQARFHLLSNEEILETFHEWPEAIKNTLVIADQCNVSFQFGTYFLPKFTVPNDMTEADYLERISLEMLEDRLKQLAKIYGPSFDDVRKDEYRERLKYEIKVIQKMGFPGYFLIVQDFINWAKSQDIPVGPGRGSGAGSLVAYSLRITDIDPLRFNLLFERFLNPERISMPDFDVDFCQDRRGEVIDYVTKKYGSANVAQIATFGKMKTKLAIRDVGRVMEVSYGRVDKIAKLIPTKVKNDRGEDVDPTISLAIAAEPRLKEESDKDSTISDILKITADLEGLNRQTGMHAAGIVMSDGPMTDYLPVFTTEDGTLITQFEMKNAEKVGLVKFDFLGLKTLTVIQKALKLIHSSRDPNFDLSLIELEDKKVYQNISTAHTIGIFQLEGEGMMQLVRKLKPSCFEDIIALVALFRPGPLGSGMVDDFVERKHGRQAIQYPLPQLQDILRETYGVILYQEQVQKTAVVLANYTPGEADLLRRAMGKKDKDVMAQQKLRFLQGAKDNQLDPQKAGEIFDLMAKFAEYGFNKSHSAAYGLVSYQTAYLKTHYTDLFMAAIMTCDLDDTDKVVRYAEDCRRLKITVRPPHINESELSFSVPTPNTISWGLAAVKGIGPGALESLIEERSRHGKFKDFGDLAKRINLHANVGKKTLELLIKVGAFDEFGLTRENMFALVPELARYSEARHQERKQGLKSLFDFEEDHHDDSTQLLSGDSDHDHDIPRSWIGNYGQKKRLTLESLHSEKSLLGLYLSGHPLDFYLTDVQRFGKSSLRDSINLAGKGPFTMVVILQSVQERITKQGNRLCYIGLSDQTGQIEAMLGQHDIPKAFPEIGTPVVVQCKIAKLPDGTIMRLRIQKIMALEEVRAHAVKASTLSIKYNDIYDPAKDPVKDSLKDSVSKTEQARVQSQHFELDILNNIRALCDKSPGPTPLALEIRYPQSHIRFQLKTCVELSDQFIRSIQDLPVEFRYGN